MIIKKHRLFFVLFFIVFGIQNILSQDFSFRWAMHIGEFGDKYEIYVLREKSRSNIEIAEPRREKSIKKKLHKAICDSLFDFCNNYNFQKRANVESYHTINKVENIRYYDTVSLSGTNKVLINSDTLYPELLNSFLYYWDEDSNKFYHGDSYYQHTICSGCTNIEGEFNSINKSGKFDYYLPLDTYEYEFFQFVVNLVLKYRKHIDLSSFEKDTHNVKPDLN